MYKKSWIMPVFVLFICGILMIFYQRTTDMNTYADSFGVSEVQFTKNLSDINKVELKDSETNIVVKRQDDTWYVTSPNKAPADDSYIYDIIMSFITPGNLHILETNIEDPLAYGITDYSTHVAFYDISGSKFELIQGNPIDEDLYYAYNSLNHSIYSIPRKVFDMLSKDLTAWYDKNYIQFNPDNVQKVTISFDGTSHTLVPQEVGTQKSFNSSTLPREKVHLILNFLINSRANAFITHNASDFIIESYGFNKNAIDIQIQNKDGSSTLFAISTTFFSENSNYVLLKPSNTIISISNFQLPLKK